MIRLQLSLLGLLLTTACLLSAPAARPTARGPQPDATASAAPTATPKSTPNGLVEIPGAAIEYYAISGLTESDLRGQLDTLGPLDDTGYRGDATTKWYVGWTWPGYGTDSCDLNQLDISYTLKVIFPRWDPPEGVPPDLVAKWTAYTSVLAAHERGHVERFLTGYASISQAIQSATCDAAEDTAQAALEALRKNDRDYDAETLHGAAQGAIFP